MHEVLPRLIHRERLVAPPGHQGVLVEPAADEVVSMWRAARPEAAIGDRALSKLRASLRARFGIVGPIVATGHQAEFFHAGVFAKNLAAGVLAARWNCSAVFLSVDSDLPKADHLRVTRCGDGQLSIERLALPGVRTDLPVEAQARAERDAWENLLAQLRELGLAGSAIGAYASGFSAAIGRGDSIALAFASGQSAVERILGIEPLRVVRMSELAATPEFEEFARYWFEHARSFAEAYNAALSDYRARHRLRSAQHPAASLTIGADEVETPFWRLLESGHRQTVSAALDRRGLDGFAFETLRPKALLLSAFGRLMLADLFIHGIGGAKYDEVTEAFIRTCFGCEPGAMVCVSATLHLHRCETAPSPEQVLAAQRRVRDFEFNPQAYIPSAPAELLRRRQETVEQINTERQRRRTREEWRTRVVPRLKRLHTELRSATQGIAATAPNRQAELRADAERLRGLAAQARIAADREAFFALHPIEELRTLRDRIRERLSGI